MSKVNTFKRYVKNYGVRRAIIKIIIKKLQVIEKKLDKVANDKYRAIYEAHLRERRKVVYEQIDNLINDDKYKYIFVFYPYCEWNLPIFQRPQQIALALTENRDDVLYFFCSINCEHDDVDVLQKVNDNLYIMDKYEYEYLMSLKTNKRILHMYSTDTISTIEDLRNAEENGDKVLYEHIDEIHEDIAAKILPKEYLQKHHEAIKNEDYYIVVTADKLLDDVEKIRKNRVLLATNGVKIEDFIFDKADDYMPEIIAKLRKKYDKIICYYGAIAKWFNYDLLKRCAKEYPNYCFLLIGIEYDTSLKENKLDEFKNIKYIGKVDYKKLIHYANKVDLLTIPFLINEITESTSPVKLFEYMAIQKPILTTDLPECRKYKSVNIAKNDDEFVKMIESSILLGDKKEYKELELKEANENTWKEKAENILEFLDNK